MKNKIPKHPVAYFVAEYAIRSDAPTYAGGLGVLAGDYLLEAAKENFPFILVSLRYRGFDAGKDGFEKVVDEKGDDMVIKIPIEKKDIAFRAWIKSYGTETCALLIDCDCPENAEEDRNICGTLYDAHFYTRVRQELALGLGGMAFLSALGIEPQRFHLNEGHTSLTALGIIAKEMKTSGSFGNALEKARAKTVFSKHTIFAEAGLYIPRGEFFAFVDRFCGAHMIDAKTIFDMGKFEKDQDLFSTTKFGVVMSYARNAVSRLHEAKEKEIHPSGNFDYVTNGVSIDRWQNPDMDRGGSDADLWQAKQKAKMHMIDFVREKSGVSLDPKALTIVWSRRFVSYKRPKLILSDEARLKKIIFDATRPVQIIFSGKAHPADEEGVKTVEYIRHMGEGEYKGKIAYVPDYSLDVARIFVQGADLWLNTPERGKEACGTSGMKAGLSGSLTCSISDGWVDEVDMNGIGWVLPEEKTAEALYDILEKEIIPEFWIRTTDIPLGWIERMKKTMTLMTDNFGADRMLADYRKRIYKI